MFRKFILALGATAVVGAAALTPTAASAHHHHGHRWFGWGGPALIVAAPACYTMKQPVMTPFGWRTQYVQVCD